MRGEAGGQWLVERVDGNGGGGGGDGGGDAGGRNGACGNGVSCLESSRHAAETSDHHVW